MKRLLWLVLFFFSIGSHADTATSTKINNWMKRNGVPGAAVEIYADGKVTSYYLGYANKEKKTPVTRDTIFEIASITKIFTTVILADQLRLGTMTLADPVTKYITDIPASQQNKLGQITLGNLATHTSGLPFNVPKYINNRQKLSNFLAKWKNPSTPIGSKWLYSNVNMGLLGFSLEKQAHKSIYQLYSEKILWPLGMRSSGAMIPESLESYYAQGYNTAGTPAPRRNAKVWQSPPNSDWIFPATGSLKSCGKDMMLFLKASLRVPGTPPNIAEAMKLTQTAFITTPRFEQGLAWIIHPDPLKNKTNLLAAKVRPGPFPAKREPSPPAYDGNALMEKTGASGGFRSYMAIIPDQKIGVVLMVNRYISSAELLRMGRDLAISQIKGTPPGYTPSKVSNTGAPLNQPVR